MQNLKNLIKFLLILITYQAFSQKAFAQSYVSTTEIVKEIEKTLLFDKDSRERVDFYKKKKSEKSDITINAGDSTESEDQKTESAVEMVIVDPKNDNFDMRGKEKLAYNATLISQYEVAIELYKQILVAEPDNVYAKFSLAVVYQKVGQFRQSKTLYYELLKTNPDNEEEIVGNMLAILVEESPKDAIYLLSRLTIQNPKSSYILAQAAIAYDKVKNYDQAISLLNKALTIDPENIAYQYNLAVTYDKTGQYEKALDLYSNVAKNYSDTNQSVPIDEIQKRIESIRNKL